MKDIYELLKTYYGYDSFRSQQEAVIRCLLSGRDAAVIMPTGAGKSLCYQIPALAMEGITLVISPLISLMQDQVRSLIANGIHAAYLNSSLTPRQMTLALHNAGMGKYKIIYAAPERLESSDFLDFALHTDISLIAVDEAHCVSLWGQDFRPGYVRIADFLRRLPHRPPVVALTATATEFVRQDILQKLELQDPFISISGFDRPNLYFGVCKALDELEFISEYAAQRTDQSGIVYCTTRKDTELVAESLKSAGLSAAAYHAGMNDALRRQVQEDFTFDRVRIIAATSAFGMGIDKPDVRYVLHYGMPACIEDYYQQAGRAGRDGEPADCILLYNKRNVPLQQYLIKKRPEQDELTPEQREEHIAHALEKLKLMTFYATSETVCLRKRLLQYFGETSHDCGRCSVCRHDSWETIAGIALDEDTIIDEALLGRLKARVKLMAMQKGIPVYAIASDGMLRELTVKKPHDLRNMSTLSGWSQEKLRQYGKAMIEVIVEYEKDCDF